MSVIKRDAQERAIPFSAVLRTRDWLEFKGEVGLGGDGELVKGGIFPEFEAIVERLRSMLWSCERVGLDSIVNATIYVKNVADSAAMKTAYAKILPKPQKPARIIIAEELSHEGAHVEVEAVAYIKPEREEYSP